jgi:flagellar protein FliS
MMNQRAIKQYQKVNAQSSIDGASPHQLIAMLINGAITRLSTAKGCMERKDFAGKGVQLGKSIDIIDGLQGCLDMDAGGDVSAKLDSLYDYMIRRLSEASRNNDMEIVNEVIGLLHNVKAGWDGIPEEFHHVSKQKPSRVAG